MTIFLPFQSCIFSIVFTDFGQVPFFKKSLKRKQIQQNSKIVLTRLIHVFILKFSIKKFRLQFFTKPALHDGLACLLSVPCLFHIFFHIFFDVILSFRILFTCFINNFNNIFNFLFIVLSCVQDGFHKIYRLVIYSFNLHELLSTL